MPKKPPKKVALKVLVPEELMPEIDKLVADGDYNGYGDLVLALIRKCINERRHETAVRNEYEIYQQLQQLEKKQD